MNNKNKRALALTGSCLIDMFIGTLITTIIEIAIESVSTTTQHAVYGILTVVCIIVLFFSY